MHNAADEEIVAEAKERLELKRKQLLEDVKTLMELAAGIRYFRVIMERGKVFQTTFTGNSTGMFLEGHRNLALSMLHDVLEAAPDKAAKLLVNTDREENQ